MYGIINDMKDAKTPATSARPTVRPSRRAPRGATTTREALTPDTWIDAATEVLVAEGIDHVRVDVLAKQLGVTRGSFYWHFRDRDDLLRRVLQAWSERATLSLTRRLASASADPRERLLDMISLPHRGRSAERAARIELAIRAWARRDEMARQALDEADRSRLEYHQEAFLALGLDPVEARARAFLTYAYEVGESLLHHHGSTAAREARRLTVGSLVLAGTPVLNRAAKTPPAPAKTAGRTRNARRGLPRDRSDDSA